MANNSFNFNKVKRKYFNVTLKGSGKTLLVAMPKKSTFEKMAETAHLDQTTDDAYDQICATLKEILDNNKQGYVVSWKELQQYDLEEILAFMQAYSAFVQGLENEKN